MKTGFRRFFLILTALVMTVVSLPLSTASAGNADRLCADITFVIDTTGSMGRYIRSVVSNLSKFIDAIQGNGIDYRLSLVEFRDVTFDPVPVRTHMFGDSAWTDDYESMRDALGDLYADGGGDNEETPSNALYDLPKGRAGVKQFVFLLTDAGFKSSADSGDVIDMSRAIDKLLRDGSLVTVVGNTDHKDAYSDLYTKTDGIFIDITSADYYLLMLQVAEWITDYVKDVIPGTFKYPGTYNDERDSSADYYYSDGYFLESGTRYNEHLATMSLCLELSAWSTWETNKWEPDMYRNAEELLGGIGFEGFEASGDWGSEPTMHSIGAVAAYKPVTLGKGGRSTPQDFTLIALAVRGGGYYSEWGGNFALGESGEHYGFAAGRDKVLEFLRQYIAEHEITGRIKIWLVGYSRAGAVANMVAGRLDEQAHDGRIGISELPDSVTLTNDDLFCYAFEPPQGATKEETGDTSLFTNIHNIVNLNDPVPYVAMSSWGFDRYGGGTKYEHILPHASSNAFGSALKIMKEELKKLDAGIPDTGRKKGENGKPKHIEYQIAEYAQKLVPDVNWTKIAVSGAFGFAAGSFIGGPYIGMKLVDSANRTGAVLDSIVNQTLTGAFSSRDHYFIDGIEEGLTGFIEWYMSYDERYTKDKKLADLAEGLFTVFSKRIKADDYAFLRGCFDTMFCIKWDYSSEERKKDVSKQCSEFVQDCVLEWLRTVFTDEKDVKKAYDLLGNVITALKQLISTEVISLKETGNSDLVNLLTVPLAGYSIFQPHYPEITLAWLRSQDSYYTDTPVKLYMPDIVRRVSINCPVKVRVYDEDGTEVVFVDDPKRIVTDTLNCCFIGGDDEVRLDLPGDGDYRVEFEPTGDGTMSMSVSEYSIIRNEVVRSVGYLDVPIVKGETLTAGVPAVPEAEYDAYLTGSTVNYDFTDAVGAPIAPTVSSSGAGSAVKYRVTAASSDEMLGSVTGGGEYADGMFAAVEAVPHTAGEFGGWYIGSELVSADPVYRFPVRNDTELRAVFTEKTVYKVTFRASGSGSVPDITVECPAGTSVVLWAQPDDGFVFDRWTGPEGTVFADAGDPGTVFTVPARDTELTAVFRDSVPADTHASPWLKALYVMLLIGALALVVFIGVMKSQRRAKY